RAVGGLVPRDVVDEVGQIGDAPRLAGRRSGLVSRLRGEGAVGRGNDDDRSAHEQSFWPRRTTFDAVYGHVSSSFTAPKSISVVAVIGAPGATLWVQTFQFESSTWARPSPLASCDVVKNTALSVSAW